MKYLAAIAVVLMFFVVFTAQAFAAWDITLGWDASVSADVTGYRIYKRLPGEAYVFGTASGMKLWEGAALTASVQIPDDECFFVATAFDNSGNESDPSNEVEWDKKKPEPPQNFLLKLWQLVLNFFRGLFENGPCIVSTAELA